MGSAFMADIYGLVYWLFILGSIGVAFAWLWQLLDKWTLRKGWDLVAVFVVLLVAIPWIGAKADRYREMAGNPEPGTGIGFAVLMLFGAAILVLPFVLIFGSGARKNG